MMKVKLLERTIISILHNFHYNFILLNAPLKRGVYILFVFLKYNLFKIVIFLFITQLSNSQEVIDYGNLFSKSDKFLKYHDEWGKSNYLKKINEFNKNQLSFGQVVFLGNSITEGGNDWGNRLSISNAVNRGIGGDTSLGIIGRIGEIKFFKPKAVFLLIGINDLWNNDPDIPSQKTIKKNILTIVKTIKKASPETKMFLQTILPTSKKIYNLKIESINNFLKKNQQKSLYQIVDLYSIFVNDKGYIKEGLTTDGIHINEKGYEKWAKYIKPLIKDL